MHASVQTVSAQMSPMDMMSTLVIAASVHMAMKETLTSAMVVMVCIYHHLIWGFTIRVGLISKKNWYTIYQLLH